MILPDKITKINNSLLYKSIQYYNKSKILTVTSKKDITYLTILFALKYIDYQIIPKTTLEGEVEHEIKIIKIK